MKTAYTVIYELYCIQNIAKFPTAATCGNFTSVMKENEFTKDSFKVISIKESRKHAIWRWWYRNWGYKKLLKTH